ncbi:MAG: PD-(D/E)XK nuclease family protein [Bacteroidia bacterium]|nr:PD-(D/E)XK nuclease family protein [Bacteroidia bacterium]
MSLLSKAQREALAQCASRGNIIVVADPFFAEALKADTGYARITDIYTWAVEKLNSHFRKPDPLDLFEAYTTALKAVDALPEMNIAEAWETAQRLGRDWEEVLRGTLSSKEADIYWQNLKDHRNVQESFSLFHNGEVPDWLRVLPFPRKKPEHVKAFWQKLDRFLAAYKEYLRKARITFSEAALQELIATSGKWEGVIFLHLYSVYPVVKSLLSVAQSRGAEVWAWNTQPLEEVLPKIWSENSTATRLFDWEKRRRTAYLHTYPTLLEVVEEAATAISRYLKENPSASIAVWCEGETAALMRLFLEQRYSLRAKLSPKSPTLLEKTQVGQILYPYFPAGMQESLSTWPEVSLNTAESEELWALTLYNMVRQNSAPNTAESWRFLLKLLQGEAPMRPSWSPETQIYLGRLTQISSGFYDAVFIIEPSAEPLGKWMRPSFWIASLRQRFSPPHLHHQMGWRLMSLLLWGGREIYLFRRADMQYMTPLEEFLTHTELFGTEEIISTLTRPSTPSQKPSSFPLSPDKPISPSERLTPSHMSQLLTCPRRVYWDRLLGGRPPSESAQIGTLLHSVISKPFLRRNKSHSLRQLLHLLNPRRIYYRLASRRGRFAPSDTSLWRAEYRLLRPLMSETGYPLLKTLIDLTSETPSSSFSRKLRWRHASLFPKYRFKIKAESSVALPEPPLYGRVDLLVEAEKADPNTGEVQKRIFLLDLKSSLRSESQKITEALQSIREGCEQLGSADYMTPEDYRDVVFQLLMYVWMFQQLGKKIDQAALVSLWWRPSNSADEAKESRCPYEIYAPDELALLSVELSRACDKIISYLRNARYPKDFPMTKQRQYCTYCDFALLCDRLS